MPEFAPELLVLPSLAVAAGLDLYLTLLLLGASPTIGLWDDPLPGALGDLDSPGVLIMVGAMYVLEFTAERYATAMLVWNAFHAIIRPVSGALLALLVLEGQPFGVVVVGALLSGMLASVAHSVRSGESVIRWLGSVTVPSVLLVSLLEDTIVVGLVALTLDLPIWAMAATGVLLVAVSPRAPSEVRAFAFAVRLAGGRVFQTLTQRRWLGPDELPDWVRAVLEDDDVFAPGGALRGSPVAAYRVPGSPRFVTGWVLVRGGAPILVFKRRGSVQTVVLGTLGPEAVHETSFFRRVEVKAREDRRAWVFFGLNGPSAASLRAEFLLRAG